MIEEAEKRGDIKSGDTLIEPTSGNTGHRARDGRRDEGLPDDPGHAGAPIDGTRDRSMRAFGAELVLTPKAGGMEYARDLAAKMRDDGKGIILDQFANPDNPLAHYRGTGPEIWRDTHGAITHFVSAMGTTGTIMGVSRFLKEKNPAIQIVGAQPSEGSQIPGIRKWPDAYLPKIFDRSRVDRIELVSQADAEAMTRRLAMRRGHLLRSLGRRRVRRRAARRARNRKRDDRVRRLRSRRPLSFDRRVSRLKRHRSSQRRT